MKREEVEWAKRTALAKTATIGREAMKAITFPRICPEKPDEKHRKPPRIVFRLFGVPAFTELMLVRSVALN